MLGASGELGGIGLHAAVGDAPSLAGVGVGVEENEPALDEGGIEQKDIELVMTQANVVRNRAIRALRDNNGDLVNAIMVPLHTRTHYTYYTRRTH